MLVIHRDYAAHDAPSEAGAKALSGGVHTCSKSPGLKPIDFTARVARIAPNAASVRIATETGTFDSREVNDPDALDDLDPGT